MPGHRLPLLIGLRYSFSRRRNRFIGVVSMVSLLGMALGVASLIAVLAVMNGFAVELRDRILNLVPHLVVESTDGPLEDWPSLLDSLADSPRVAAAAPYVETKVLLSGRQLVRGALLTAVDPDRESTVSKVAAHIVSGGFAELDRVPYSLVLGSLLARALDVTPGDSVEVTVPRLTYTPLGSYPRSRRFTVVGIFEVGAQLDGGQAYTSLAGGQKLMGIGDAVDGLRLRLDDLFDAPGLAENLSAELGPGYRVEDWGRSQGNLFAAVRMEKTMMTVLLLSVIAVAAFNIVSTLTMAVTEKRSDIAVLRTMGAGASSIMAIFVAQGLLLAVVGVGAGALVGAIVATNISEAAAFVERLAGTKLFDPRVYFISDLPSRLQWGDVALVSVLALALSLLATLFPAWRAARIAPAEVLRHE